MEKCYQGLSTTARSWPPLSKAEVWTGICFTCIQHINLSHMSFGHSDIFTVLCPLHFHRQVYGIGNIGNSDYSVHWNFTECLVGDIFVQVCRVWRFVNYLPVFCTYDFGTIIWEDSKKNVLCKNYSESLCHIWDCVELKLRYCSKCFSMIDNIPLTWTGIMKIIIVKLLC
jgi:hypothetical protein